MMILHHFSFIKNIILKKLILHKEIKILICQWQGFILKIDYRLFAQLKPSQAKPSPAWDSPNFACLSVGVWRPSPKPESSL